MNLTGMASLTVGVGWLEDCPVSLIRFHSLESISWLFRAKTESFIKAVRPHVRNVFKLKTPDPLSPFMLVRTDGEVISGFNFGTTAKAALADWVEVPSDYFWQAKTFHYYKSPIFICDLFPVTSKYQGLVYRMRRHQREALKRKQAAGRA